MRFLLASAIGAFAASVLAAPTEHTLHEKRDVQHGWEKRDRVSRLETFPVRIGLTQRNLEHGDRLLHEVSDPFSPKYGQHYTEEEVNELFAPSEESVNAVLEWLHEHGFDPESISQSFNKQWIQFDAKVGDVERLLRTKYHMFEHVDSGHRGLACDEYHVPKRIQHHIDYITPGVKMHIEKKSRRTMEKEKRQLPISLPPIGLPPIIAPLPLPLPALLALTPDIRCGEAVTPDCIQLMYKYPTNKKAVKGNDMGVFEDIGDVYSEQDLANFLTVLGNGIPTDTHPILQGVDGGTAPAPSVANAGIESDLDFQISYPILYPQNSILFQTDDPVYEANYTYRGFFNNLLYALDGSYCSNVSPLDPQYPHNVKGGYKKKLMCGAYKPPHVMSISYGGQEPSLPVHYQRRQCNEFLKLGMRGMSTVMASGDSGVGVPSGKCLGNDAHFDPDFAASCPYLTAAGATVLPTGGNPSTDHEVAVSSFGSGGGFSNIYKTPSYQKKAVSTYLTKHKPSYASYVTENNPRLSHGGPFNGKYNRAGRGYPDVGAIGDNVVIFAQGTATLVGGTSAAAPVVAALLTRINGERISAGKKPIGFANPVFYAHPEMFNDVTSGSNPGCGTNGFNCAPGWDPVTGLGTPNYPKMLKVFMALP